MDHNSQYRLITVHTTEQIETIRTLFIEYQQWLNFSLCFQGFDKELAELPGKYAPPRGSLYLATVEGETAGCIGMRPLDEEGVCEMKRLYVREQFRKHGIGRKLVQQTIVDARSAGYRTMRLDTLQRMEPARALYRSLGFTVIPAYYNNPLDEVVYMELDLQQ